jgi:hypothetical protein
MFMPNPYFHILQPIADAVNPLLLLIALGLAIFSTFKKDKIALPRLIAITVIVYGLMFLDTKLKLWEMFSGDYSTHTAIGLTVFIYFQTRLVLLKRGVCTVFLFYCALMVYQKYHTAVDLISTALIIIALILPLYVKEIKSVFIKN